MLETLFLYQHINIVNTVTLQTLLPKDSLPFENIFDFTTAGDWDCVAAVERFPALYYSVDFIFLSFGIMDFIVKLWDY